MVSDRDRETMQRHAAALATVEHTDEGSVVWRADLHEWINAERHREGRGELCTEPEFYRRAESLGLRRRVP